MELRHLRYFQAVAEELSFSKAARRLHIAQPAISRAIQELEADLGAQLLARTRRSVQLTPSGAVLYHETELLLQRLEEALRRVQRTAAGEEGELRLGYVGPPTQEFLGRIVLEFRSRFPRVSVILEERTPERVWEMVAQGRLALGITRPVLANRALGLHSQLLRRERLCAILPHNHPLASPTNSSNSETIRWNQLANHPLILLARRESASLHDAILTACRRARFTPKITQTPSLISTVLSYVEAGSGVGVASETVAAIGHGLPLVFRPLVPAQTVDLVVVWSDVGDSPPARAFRSLLQEWHASRKLWRTPTFTSTPTPGMIGQ